MRTFTLLAVLAVPAQCLAGLTVAFDAAGHSDNDFQRPQFFGLHINGDAGESITSLSLEIVEHEPIRPWEDRVLWRLSDYEEFKSGE